MANSCHHGLKRHSGPIEWACEGGSAEPHNEPQSLLICRMTSKPAKPSPCLSLILQVSPRSKFWSPLEEIEFLSSISWKGGHWWEIVFSRRGFLILFNAYYFITGMVISTQNTNYSTNGMLINTWDTSYSIGGMVIGFPPEFRVTVYVQKWSRNFFHFHYGQGSGKPEFRNDFFP